MGATIMVCDDDPLCRGVVKDMLESLGHRVLEAGSTAELKQTALSSGADLFILDMNMPGGGGREAVRFLRAEPPTADAPILIASAVQAIDQATAFQGIKDIRFLQKPITYAGLESALRASLEGNPPGK